jgi:hypothetical protein
MSLRGHLALWASCAFVTSLAGCSGDETTSAEGAPSVALLGDYRAGAAFFDAPFPSDARRDAAGKPVVAGFPNPKGVFLVDRILDLIARDADGFGLSSGVFFRASAPLDPASLPDLASSVLASSPVQLVGVDPAAPDYGVRYPIDARFTADPGPYGAPDLLSLLPLQGAPLRPHTRYAAFVTRAVRDASGRALGASEALASLSAGSAPDGMSDAVAEAHRAALDAIAAAGTPASELVALTVFTTGDPVSGMGAAIEAARATALPVPNEVFARTDEFPTFCVYAATMDMPVYQEGEPPFEEEGGGFVLDASGAPVLQGTERARFFVTVPKGVMPEAGFPLVVFSRTGGGGDRPLVDRGVRAVPGGEAVVPGTGPALELARVGFAGASVDGPHGGLRNITQGDEQFLVFNFQNSVALRDNVRQSALELALLPDVLEGVSIDVADCPGVTAPGGVARFDTGTLAVMGHSMGAAISPLALVFEPRLRAAVLSGAGGSFLENVIHKQKPLQVKPLAEVILALAGSGYGLTEETPILSMLQWAGEPADAPLYGRYVVREPLAGAPRHVLMMQGIVDHYILPPIANATSLSFGLDLAGAELDDGVEELAAMRPLGELLPLVGRSRVDLPAQGNAASVGGEIATAIVTQTAEDGVEDGHEVAYQTDPPKHAYACFLAGLAAGAPRVPAIGAPGDPCE